MLQDSLTPIVRFLAEIGLSIREEVLSDDTFLPGICISRGTLVFDRGRLKWACDLLHEAGHLAVTPAERRHDLDDRLAGVEEGGAGEIESIAWSYAAAVHLSLPLGELFHDGGYRGQARRLAFTYAAGVYPGVAGLEQAGLTFSPARAAAEGVQPYPHMVRWLRG